MTYDDLHKAFLAFRREHGLPAAIELIEKHGGKSTLDSVPEDKWPALAFTFSRPPVPKSLEDIAPRAWARFNNPPKRSES
jgi:hypothetical protein